MRKARVSMSGSKIQRAVTKCFTSVCVCVCAFAYVTHSVVHLVTETLNSVDVRMLCCRTDFLLMHKSNLLFDPCAFMSSCCIWILTRSLKLKRPESGRCDQTSHHCVFMFLFMSSFVAASLCLLICSVLALVSAVIT